MINLSVIIITLNEEKNISRCIESVKKVADEIIVVDSFSTDRTKEIAVRLGAKFITNAFKGHIEQKNFGLAQCSNHIVLSLDADEELSEELIQSILEAKNNWKYDGYYMNRLNRFCGKWIKHSGWYPDKKIRLFDKRKGQWGGTNPHDKFIPNKNASIGALKGDLLHYTINSIGEQIKQNNYFSSIAANMAYEKGKRSSLFLILLSPLFKFIRNYFFKLGVLDGYFGFVICINTAHETFLKYIKLRELQKNKKML